jgi:alkylation response protein AidB-like acyl-CoA dehydrogenase
MRRDVFTEENEMFRAQVRRFAEREIEPRVERWNRDGITARAGGVGVRGG